jgi:hypothetical protein
MRVVKEDSFGRKKRKDGKFKFSLKDLIQQYKQYAPKRYKKEYTSNDLGSQVAEENFVDAGGNPVEEGDEYTSYLRDLDPETQKEMIERGEISVKDIRGGAKREGGGGKTVIKGLKGGSSNSVFANPIRTVYKGTKEGGTKVKTRYGKFNPFKTLKKSIQTLRETGMVQPNF